MHRADCTPELRRIPWALWAVYSERPSSLFNILVHADLADRIRRVQELFCLEAGDAKKLIAKNDRDRDAYTRTFARKDWLDARWYDLCVNTSCLGMGKNVAAAML
jgi:hypothetical protein